jgi:4-amino-4-deoxy-L-arabinose transferase-like glycosyltransferase
MTNESVQASIGQAGRQAAPSAVIVAIAVAAVLFTLFLGVPGHLTWDSGTYHLAAQSLAETGDFFIDNGYDGFPSPLLQVGQTVAPTGRLVSQYPEFYTLLTAPFYAVFDYRGLMLLNTLAFIGTTALIWRLAGWYSDDPAAPRVAVLVYAWLPSVGNTPSHPIPI